MTLDEENSWMIFFQFDEEYGYNERNMDIFFFFFSFGSKNGSWNENFYFTSEEENFFDRISLLFS